jgi:hypothetical protein
MILIVGSEVPLLWKRSPKEGLQRAKKLVITAMIEGVDHSVDAMVAEDQVELVNSEVLPTKANWPRDSKELLEAAGVVFGDPLQHDPMFCQATLPAGWKKERMDHPMWSKLVDDKGRTRAKICYKEGMHDRDAFFEAQTLFTTEMVDWAEYHKTGKAQYQVLKGSEVVFTTPVVSYEKGDRMDAQQKAETLAEEWLATHYSDWKDPSKYWDE